MRWVNQSGEDTMGTVVDIRSREIVDLDRVAALLDRLEWRLDQPCSVPGCSHDGDCCGGHRESAVQAAA